MPEYKRFIAYFYEYIDGKRRRNAGFVKAEQRNGVWRLQVQLRSENWPQESLPIFGFSRNEEEYPVVWLGKGYPKGDSMIQPLQISSKDLEINFESLSGMWIPCQEDRCFLSNWEDAEVEPDRLRTPHSEGGAGTETIVEKDAEQVTEKATEETAQQDTEKLTQEAAEQVTENRNVDEILVEAMECATVEEKEQKADSQPSVEIEIQSQSQSSMQEPETERDVPGNIQEDQKEENQKRQAMESDWRTLLSQCQRFRPFAEEEFEECIRICPRDVLWLGQRQWPVGRNSFLMQGFYKYRHLLLARKTDGSYVLGVPGRMMPQNQSVAASFGFENFKAVNSAMICPENFGYWYRIISI